MPLGIVGWVNGLASRLTRPLIRTQGQGPSHIACPPLTHTLGGRDVGPLTPPKAQDAVIPPSPPPTIIILITIHMPIHVRVYPHLPIPSTPAEHIFQTYPYQI